MAGRRIQPTYRFHRKTGKAIVTYYTSDEHRSSVLRRGTQRPHAWPARQLSEPGQAQGHNEGKPVVRRRATRAARRPPCCTGLTPPRRVGPALARRAFADQAQQHAITPGGTTADARRDRCNAAPPRPRAVWIADAVAPAAT
jgi:hypothetical protein